MTATIDTARVGTNVYLTLDQIRAIAIDSATAFNEAQSIVSKAWTMRDEGRIDNDTAIAMVEASQKSRDVSRAIWTAMTSAYFEQTGVDLWVELGLA